MGITLRQVEFANKLGYKGEAQQNFLAACINMADNCEWTDLNGDGGHIRLFTGESGAVNTILSLDQSHDNRSNVSIAEHALDPKTAFQIGWALIDNAFEAQEITKENSHV